MNLRSIFINENGRPRSGWRFSVYLIATLFVGGAVLSVLTEFLKVTASGYAPMSILALVSNFAVMLPAAVFFAWLFGLLLEDLPFRALGMWFTKRWFVNMVLGLIFGAAAICLAALIANVFGGISFHFNADSGRTPMLLTIGTTLVIFILGAAFEEVLFRGYTLQTFARSGLAIFGVVITSVLFATIHNGNPNANPLSWFNTFLAGIWFAVAYFRTRDLWFPFGIHLTWNWFQGAILGIPVSGLTELAPAPILRATDHGPAWLTGGTYGLEAGIACTFALLVSTALIWYLPIFKPTEEMIGFSSEQGAVVSGQ